MAVQIHITHDPHNPHYVPRDERAANIDAAAAAAIRLGLSCTITAPARRAMGIMGRTVEFVCGTMIGLADAPPGELAALLDDLGRWHRRAGDA